MINAPNETGFYIGYVSRVPEGQRVLLLVVAACLVMGFAITALLLALDQVPPGDGYVRWEMGPQTVSGTLEMHPAPVIHLAPSITYPRGRTLMLSGQGKTGVQTEALQFDGRAVELQGFIAQRGELDMLIVDKIEADRTETSPFKIAVRDLGRWRLTGEICDGKCYSGVMRPGQGIAHKACANLCLFGGVPPVFIANGTVGGHSHFLIADATGQPVARRILDLVAVPVTLEGRIEQRGALAVLLLDVPTLRAL